jgi:hypothetical protein
MRARTLGNSSTHVRKQVAEQHSETHATKALQFLQAREPFQLQASRGLFHLQFPPPIPPMQQVPRPRWFLAVYVRDVVGRIEETKAQITSIFGNILKMDSTKKVFELKTENILSISGFLTDQVSIKHIINAVF